MLLLMCCLDISHRSALIVAGNLDFQDPQPNHTIHGSPDQSNGYHRYGIDLAPQLVSSWRLTPASCFVASAQPSALFSYRDHRPWRIENPI